jgi:hypothetical protein
MRYYYLKPLKLLASSATKEGIQKLVAQFYCTNEKNILLAAVDSRCGYPEFDIYKLIDVDKYKHIAGTRVIEQKGRYRFELLRVITEEN